MSHSFIDRSSNYFTQNYDNEETQKKIDPIAQLKEINNTTVREWGLFNNHPAQMFAKEEEDEKVQAKNEDEELQKKATSENEKKQSGSSGTKTNLPDDVKSKMESSFGTDFSGVNIHTNSDQATYMGALAYTQGSDVHFAPGQYNPSSQKGQELIGHELTHVMQQRQGRVKPEKQGKGMNINSNPALENEADVMGAKAAQGKMADVAGKGSGVQKKAIDEKVREFQSKSYSLTNFVPATGRGLFNISLNPINGRLEIKLNLGFNFVDGSAAAFTGVKGDTEKWTEDQKKEWKDKYITLIEGRWGGKYHFSNPDLPGITVYVDVEIEEVDTDWHYQLNVTKAAPGTHPQSSVAHYLSGGKALSQVNNHFATLDSNDLEWKDLTSRAGVTEKQKGALHEFGHMIGLGDEYNDGKAGISHAALVLSALGENITEGDSNDIMSCGNSINKQHYVTFLDALNSVTEMNNWEFKN